MLSPTRRPRALLAPSTWWRPLVLERPRVWRPRSPEADLAAALPPWLTARVIVASTLVAAHAIASSFPGRVPEPIKGHVVQGLLGWDAERYLQIAASGYAALPRIDIRFFPLFPLAARFLDPVVPGGPGAVLLVVANLAALAFGMVLHRLALHETGDARLARRAAWFAAIFPAGFVFAWGYTEALWAALSAGVVLAARRERWWLAAVLGAGAGLLRPVGALVALPVLIEVVRRRRWTASGAVAIAAPVAAACSYLWWVGRTFGDPLLPFTIQQSRAFRGRTTDPVRALWHPATALLHGQVSLVSVRAVWAVALAALLVVVWRRWPVSYAAFATAMVLVALSTTKLGSFERYAFTTFPVLLGLATISRRPVVERALLVGGGALLGLYGLLALLGAYVP